MKCLFVTITRHTLLLAVLLLAAALLACGPATQSAPGEQTDPQSGQQDADGTPEPAEEDSPKYPKLDATFQQLVQRFEAGELSETEAAALAPDHFESLVMVTVDVSSNLEAIDYWLSRENLDYPRRFVNPDHVPMYINTWVPVSLLVSLSQQEGVIVVSSTYDYFLYEKSASGDGVIEGRLPLLPPKPTQKYPAIYDTGLHDDVVELEATREAANQAVGEEGGARGQQNPIEDTVIDVTVYLTANTLIVAEWARSKGITTVHVREYEDGSGGEFDASVPLSLLGALASQEGVMEIYRHRPVVVDKE